MKIRGTYKVRDMIFKKEREQSILTPRLRTVRLKKWSSEGILSTGEQNRSPEAVVIK